MNESVLVHFVYFTFCIFATFPIYRSHRSKACHVETTAIHRCLRQKTTQMGQWGKQHVSKFLCITNNEAKSLTLVSVFVFQSHWYWQNNQKTL